MSVRNVSTTRLICDGCGRERDFDTASDATEARIEAARGGWKYRMFKVAKKGQRGGTTHRVYDACDLCEMPTEVKP